VALFVTLLITLTVNQSFSEKSERFEFRQKYSPFQELQVKLKNAHMHAKNRAEKYDG
jgi:hypothetical protein